MPSCGGWNNLDRYRKSCLGSCPSVCCYLISRTMGSGQTSRDKFRLLMEHTCHGTGSQNTSGVDYWEYKPPINCSTEPLEYGHRISCKGAECGRDVDNRNKKTLQKSVAWLSCHSAHRANQQQMWRNVFSLWWPETNTVRAIMKSHTGLVNLIFKHWDKHFHWCRFSVFKPDVTSEGRVWMWNHMLSG